MLKSIIQLVAITFVILFLFNISNKPSLTNINTVSFGDVSVRVDLAITERARVVGLSGRESLAEDAGLLFIFDQPDKYAFWMKNMNFPIDIIWLASSTGGESKDLEIVYIKQNAIPESFPEIFGPDKDAQYILEVVAGFSKKHNLKVGDKAEFGY